MSIILAVVGSSKTGKTQLIERLVAELKKRGRTVAVIKHCPHGFLFDVEGKDSHRFFGAGADGVAMAGPDMTAVVNRSTAAPNLISIARNSFPDADIVLVEGGKGITGFRKMEILRHGISEEPSISSSELAALVADFAAKSDKPVLNLEDIPAIADFVEKGVRDEARRVILEIDKEEFKAAFFAKRDPQILKILRRSTVGIAGGGGLGSNVAVSLARVGVGRLIIADFDRIEPSNLNRQQYFVEQVGRIKVEALLENLKKINPFSEYEIHNIQITREDVPKVFGAADLLVEAFDRAEQKHMLMESWLSYFPDRPVILASGLAGFGRNENLHTRRLGNLFICGDEESECPEGISPMAPRVAVVANMQANLAVELLVNRHLEKR